MSSHRPMAAAEEEISPIDSDEHGTAGSATLENYSESVVHAIHRVLISATSIFVISLAVMQLIKRSEGVGDLAWKLLFSKAGQGVIALCVLIHWLSRITSFTAFATYSRAALVVLQAYALLLLVDVQYIRTVMIPLIILAFIGALFGNFWKKTLFRCDYKALDNMNSTEPTKVQLVSLSLQLLSVILTLYRGHENKIFIISHFLMFFSTSLSAVTVMVASLPLAVNPGVLKVLPILQNVCIVVLLITVHTNAAVWLGKDILLACIPELAAILVWFAIHYDHGGQAISIHDVTSRKSEFVVLGTVMFIMACQHGSVHSEDWNSIQTRALRISCCSSALSYFSVWLLHQRPEGLSDSNGPVKLLKFSGEVSFYAMSVTAVLVVGRWVPYDETIFLSWVVANVVVVFLLYRVVRHEEATSPQIRSDPTIKSSHRRCISGPAI